MVIIKDYNKMFWGVTIDAGKRYSQVVDQGFHVSMAALEITAKKPSENVQVMLQHDSTEYLLCTLHNSLLQQPLDLNFATGEQVSFSLNGSGIVHLTGYLIPDDDDEPSYEESFSESDDDEEAPSLVDTSADGSILVGKRKADDSLRKSKKLKLSDSYIDDGEDDSDEDDEDYTAEEEEFSDDFDDDSFAEEDSEDESDLEDDDDEEEDEESPTKKGKKTTPDKALKAASEPNTSASKKIKVKQELNTSKQDGKSPKTPNQQSSEKQNGKAKQESQKKNQQAPGTPSEKAPQTPSTPADGEIAKKKKKKKKKKKNKEGGDESQNVSTASTPATSPKAETTPATTPKKRVVAGGTIVEDIKVGHGPEAKPGKMASVYYVGVLAKNNKRFDSCTEGKPFRFRLNQGEVIKGWDVGVTGMKVGGKRKITVPASQAYGNVKQGPIPPNSTLVFEVELKAVS